MNAQQATVLMELRAWIRRHWDLEMTVRSWWADLAGAGWAFPSWPDGLGGRDYDGETSRVIRRELAAAGTIGPPTGVGLSMGAPTLLRHGNRAQHERFLPALASGATEWCQLFSEPDAGSDLAGLQTRALPTEHGWTVDGQKVWSSKAHEADFGMLLARTDASRPKHRGISFMLISMNQPGIEVLPLRQMNGACDFNEVFIVGATVRNAELVGELNGGWAIAQTTLANERNASRQRGAIRPGPHAGMLDLSIGQAQECARTDAGGSRVYGRSGRAMIQLARDIGRQLDPPLRDRIVRLHIQSEISKYTALRAEQARAAGRPVGPESSIGKLAASHLAHFARDVAFEVMGAAGMLSGADACLDGEVHLMCLSAHKVSLGGGTDEVQRNIIAERVLGLPREHDLSRSVPFNESGPHRSRSSHPDGPSN